jgi:hypothetical protein
MKLVIESDGTLKGTRLDFQMTADELPKMIARAKRGEARRLKHVQPPNAAPAPTPRRHLTAVS